MRLAADPTQKDRFGNATQISRCKTPIQITNKEVKEKKE
jgi:hypothetical protein